MSGISLDGTCLKISSIINPRRGPQAATPRGHGWTFAATISIPYLVFSSLSTLPGRVAGPDCPDCISSHQSASGNVGWGTLFQPHQKHPRLCVVHATRVGARSLQRQGHTPGRPRAIVGSRSSGAPGRPGPGTGGSSQDRLLRPRDRPHTTASRPHTHTHTHPAACASAAAARSRGPLTISVSCCGCVFDPSADPRPLV